MIPETIRTRVSLPALSLWSTLIGLYVVLRLWGITSYGLWVDEVFSVRAAGVAWSQLFGLLAADAIHPPFFYVLLKLWIAIGGTSLLWLKLLPVIVSVSALVPFWLLCREVELRLEPTALALWLMTVSGILVHYSQEVRMYSLLFFLSLWSLWLFVRVLKADRASARQLAPLFLVGVLLVHTHYFGWLVVGTEWLCVLIWRPRLLGRLSLVVGSLALAFAPWAYAVAVLRSNENMSWIPRPGWPELIWLLATLNGILPWRHTAPLGAVLFGAPIAFAFARGLWGRRAEPTGWLGILGMFCLLPVMVAFGASRLMPHSVWGERHLIIVVVPYLLLAAMSLAHVRRAYLRIALGLVLATWAGVASVAGLIGGEGRIPWKSLVRHLVAQEAPSSRNVTVYTFEPWAAAPLEFLLEEVGNRRFGVVMTEPRLMAGSRFWVAFRDPTPRIDKQPRAVLEERGCRIDAERSGHDGGQRVVLFRAAC